MHSICNMNSEIWCTVRQSFVRVSKRNRHAGGACKKKSLMVHENWHFEHKSVKIATFFCFLMVYFFFGNFGTICLRKTNYFRKSIISAHSSQYTDWSRAVLR